MSASFFCTSVSASCALVLGLERGELAGSEADGGARQDAADVGGDAAIASRYTDLVLAERPLAYYPFEDQAGASFVENVVPLASPRARDGIVLGAMLGAAGARGGPDGAMVAPQPGARVELRWAEIPAGNVPFSIEVAVRPSVLDPTARWIVSRGELTDGAPSFVGYRMAAEGALVVFERVEAGGSDRVRSDRALAKDRWTHLAATFDGARLRLIVNGVVADEVRTARALPVTVTKLVVGSPGEGRAPLLGRIDELAIYDRELASEKVASHAKLILP